MAASDLVIEVRLRWWVVPYLKTLNLFALTFACEPDAVKIVKVIVRLGGLYIVTPCRASSKGKS